MPVLRGVMHAEVIASIQSGYVMLGWQFQTTTSSLCVGKRGNLKKKKKKEKPRVSREEARQAFASGVVQTLRLKLL